MRKCDGICSREGNCRGEVRRVWSGPFLATPTWDWWYCETAIETDKANGFTVETDEEHFARKETSDA